MSPAPIAGNSEPRQKGGTYTQCRPLALLPWLSDNRHPARAATQTWSSISSSVVPHKSPALWRFGLSMRDVAASRMQRESSEQCEMVRFMSAVSSRELAAPDGAPFPQEHARWLALPDIRP